MGNSLLNWKLEIWNNCTAFYCRGGKSEEAARGACALRVRPLLPMLSAQCNGIAHCICPIPLVGYCIYSYDLFALYGRPLFRRCATVTYDILLFSNSISASKQPLQSALFWQVKDKEAANSLAIFNKLLSGLPQLSVFATVTFYNLFAIYECCDVTASCGSQTLQATNISKESDSCWWDAAKLLSGEKAVRTWTNIM